MLARVSVVLPTYRRNDLLPGAIESVLAQTFGDFDLVVSDNDCSPEVEQLVASYGDRRLRYRHNGVNIGALRGGEAAYRAATAPLVATLHDDDLWEPQLLERLVPLVEADDGLALAFGDVHIMDGAGRVDARRSDENTAMWRRDVLRPGVHRPFQHVGLVDRAVTMSYACVMRRRFVEDLRFPDDVRTGYDLWLTYLACREGLGAHYVPERLARVRQHEGSLTANVALDQAMIAIFDRLLADPALGDLHRQLRAESAPFRTTVGVAELRQGRRRAARAQLLAGLRGRPDLRGTTALALSFLPVPAEPVVRLLRRAHPRPQVPDTRY